MPPESVFCYSSSGSELLGVVIREAAKQPIEDFARDVLFGPPGITDIMWTKFPNANPISGAGLYDNLLQCRGSKSPQSICTDVNPRQMPRQIALKSRRKAAAGRIGVMQFILDGHRQLRSNTEDCRTMRF
jgi:CubicO group peptidase (beta-lactamase class C family)